MSDRRHGLRRSWAFALSASVLAALAVAGSRGRTGRENGDGPPAPGAPSGCVDLDHDGFFSSAGCGSEVDCDDAVAAVRPRGRQLCGDGLNNDCGDPAWPALANTNEADEDGDGLTTCGGDCNDDDGAAFPGAPERCNGYDDDCDAQVDDVAGCPRACTIPLVPRSVLRVTDDPAPSRTPSLVWAGDGYAIAWDDYRVGRYGGEIFFSRVAADGVTEVVNDVRITDEDGPGYQPVLVWTGSKFGIATWQAFIFIRAVLVDPLGQAFGMTQSVGGGEDGAGVSLLFDGNGFAFGWSEFNINPSDVAANVSRVSRSLHREGKTKLGQATYPGLFVPDLAWNGSTYGVVWPDNRNGNREIYFARLDSAGNLLGDERRLTNDRGNSTIPAIRWNGMGWGVFWLDDRVGGVPLLYYAELDALGNRLGSDHALGLPSSPLPYFSATSAIVTTGSEYGIAYVGDDGRLWLARIDHRGKRLGPDVPISDDGAIPAAPSITWTGKNYAVAWQDTREGNPEIYFATVDCGVPQGGGMIDWYSTSTLQYAPGGTLKPEAPYGIAEDGTRENAPAIPALPAGAGLDAIDVVGDDVVFSSDADALVHHAGGTIRVRQQNAYRAKPDGTIAVEIDWSRWGISAGTLDALDLLGDGTFAFSTSKNSFTNHGGGSTQLRQQNAYRLDPANGRITLLLDGVRLGLGDLDALDVYADGRIAFSTARNVFVGGTVLRQQNAYVWTPGDGSLALAFDGAAHGLQTLDAIALAAGED